jgi:hypothetical protein
VLVTLGSIKSPAAATIAAVTTSIPSVVFVLMYDTNEFASILILGKISIKNHY